MQKGVNYEGNISELEVTFIPATSKRRSVIIQSIVEEMKKQSFKSLNEYNKQDLKQVSRLIFEMYPTTTERLTREYSRVCIRLWNRERKSIN